MLWFSEIRLLWLCRCAGWRIDSDEVKDGMKKTSLMLLSWAHKILCSSSCSCSNSWFESSKRGWWSSCACPLELGWSVFFSLEWGTRIMLLVSSTVQCWGRRMRRSWLRLMKSSLLFSVHLLFCEFGHYPVVSGNYARNTWALHSWNIYFWWLCCVELGCMVKSFRYFIVVVYIVVHVVFVLLSWLVWNVSITLLFYKQDYRSGFWLGSLPRMLLCHADRDKQIVYKCLVNFMLLVTSLRM